MQITSKAPNKKILNLSDPKFIDSLFLSSALVSASQIRTPELSLDYCEFGLVHNYNPKTKVNTQTQSYFTQLARINLPAARNLDNSKLKR